MVATIPIAKGTIMTTTNTTTTVTTTTGTAIIITDGGVSFDKGATWSYWSNIITASDMLTYLKREGKLVA
jgi:hypothetical protein